MIDLANATYGFMFFGTPHRGLAIEDMKSMIEKNNSQSRNDLLSDINTGSRLLEQQLMRFKNWIGDRKVVSFIETLQTKRLQQVKLSAPLKCLRLTALSKRTEPGLELESILLPSPGIQPSCIFQTMWKRR
jgi:hypothetical protein